MSVRTDRMMGRMGASSSFSETSHLIRAASPSGSRHTSPLLLPPSPGGHLTSAHGSQPNSPSRHHPDSPSRHHPDSPQHHHPAALMLDPQASQQRMQQMLEQQLRGQQEGTQPPEVGEPLSPLGQQNFLPQRPASVPLRPGAGLHSSSLLEELRPGSLPLHPSEEAGLQPHLPPLPEDHGRPGSVPLQLPPLASSRLVPLPGSSGVSSLRMPGSAQGGTRRNSVRWPEDVISQAASGSRPGSVGSAGHVTSAAFPTQVLPLPLIASDYTYAPYYL